MFGQFYPASGALVVLFRRAARSPDRPNPEKTRDLVDLKEDFDMGPELERAQEQMQ